jgi:histone deacetylase 11
LGLERLHPFDSHKFSRAFQLLEQRLGTELARHWHAPATPVSEGELRLVHSQAYLESLRSPAVVARALELWPLRLVPSPLLERGVLRPMRLAVAGTMLAMRDALEAQGIVMNVGGGFHHAFRDHGEGFCLYADVAIALAAERARGTLASADPILVIDLDAHRGNGVWDILGGDPAIHVFDLYNSQVYPGLFPGAVEEFPFQVPLKARTRDDAYLETLRADLPKFLDSVALPRLAIYNAGTDIVTGDPIGRLAVSPAGVRARDRLVIDSLSLRNVPTVVVTSGGYTELSHQLIADLAQHVISVSVARQTPGDAGPSS